MLKLIGWRLMTILLVGLSYGLMALHSAAMVRSLELGAGEIAKAVALLLLTLGFGALLTAVTLGYGVARLTVSAAELLLGWRIDSAITDLLVDDRAEGLGDAIATLLLFGAGIFQITRMGDLGKLIGGLTCLLAAYHGAAAVVHVVAARRALSREVFHWQRNAIDAMGLSAGLFATLAVLGLGASAGIADVVTALRYRDEVRPLVEGEWVDPCAGTSCVGRRAFSFVMPPSGAMSVVGIAFDGCSTALLHVDGSPRRNTAGEALSLEMMSFTEPKYGIVLIAAPNKAVRFAVDSCIRRLRVAEASPE